MSRKITQQVKRRDVLRATTGAVVGGGIGLSFGGIVTADDGAQRFIVHANRNAAFQIEADGFEVAYELANGRVLIVNGNESEQNDLEAIPGVQHAIPDFSIELDTVDQAPTPRLTTDQISPAADTPARFDLQWPMQVTDVLDAHETATGDGVRVAIVDTGIHPDHVDLVGNVDPEDSIAFDMEGNSTTVGEPKDVLGHGTLVAGAVAAHGANAVLGVAPDAELVSVRIFEEGEISTTAVAVLRGWEYVADIDVDVMNFSVGTFPLPPSDNAGGFRGIVEDLANHIVRSGTLLSASAGNEGVDVQRGPSVNFYTDLAGVTGSSATGPLDDLAFYSNYGQPTVSVGAPGGGHDDPIKSFCGFHEWVAAILDTDESDEAFFEAHVDVGEETRVCFDDAGFLIFDPDPDPGNEDVTCIPCVAPEYPDPLNSFLAPVFTPSRPDVDDSYTWTAGTSLSAPVTAGIAALVVEANPDLNPRQVERAIKNGAELVDGESDPELGAGRVNAANSVEEAK